MGALEGAVYAHVADRLEWLRSHWPKGDMRAEKVTQAALAKQVGVTRQTIANFENQRQRPPLHILYAICDTLDVDILDLLPPMHEVSQRRLSDRPSRQSAVLTVGGAAHEVDKQLLDRIERELEL